MRKENGINRIAVILNIPQKEVDVSQGIDFVNQCATGDLPHTSMRLRFTAENPISIFIPSTIPNSPNHPVRVKGDLTER